LENSNFLKDHLQSISFKSTYAFTSFEKYDYSFLPRCMQICCKKNRAALLKSNSSCKKEAVLKLQNDFNLVTIVTNIYKMKASLKMLVKNDKLLLMKIKREYERDRTIGKPKTESQYQQFLETDDIFELDQ
jgi:hypothetical protein